MTNRLVQLLGYTICFVLLGLVGFALVLAVPLNGVYVFRSGWLAAVSSRDCHLSVIRCVLLSLFAKGFILNPKRHVLQLTCVYYLALAHSYMLVLAVPHAVAHRDGQYLLEQIALGFLAAMASVLFMPMVLVAIKSARRLPRVGAAPIAVVFALGTRTEHRLAWLRKVS